MDGSNIKVHENGENIFHLLTSRLHCSGAVLTRYKAVKVDGRLRYCRTSALKR